MRSNTARTIRIPAIGERPGLCLALGGLALVLVACTSAAHTLTSEHPVTVPAPSGPQPVLAPAPPVSATFVAGDIKLLSDEPAVASSAPVSAAVSTAFELLVLHTNDVRGYVLPCG